MSVRHIHIEKVDSTNRWLHDYVPAEDEEMTVVTTDYQTSGRGQADNHWESEAHKNLLCSVLFHPDHIPASRQFLLSMAVALAVSKTLEHYTDGINIKWPNDIYWNDRKICGILIENRLSGQRIKDTIAGIGININQRTFHSDAPNPVSLIQITGRETPREEVTELLTTHLQQLLGELWEEAGNPSSNGQEPKALDTLRTSYHQRLYRREGFHAYRDRQGTFEARIDHVEDNGTLCLQLRNGTLRKYAFKEVEFIL
jgi:BirA family biotin operon repressor/biotin-[acetyl-CoA-carboxylase] ligase